jgi:phage shock protein A
LILTLRRLIRLLPKLAEARRRLNTLVARSKTADVRVKLAQVDLNIELDDDAFAKFERLTRKVELAEAEAKAMAELAGGCCELDRSEQDSEGSIEDLELDAELIWK